MLARSFVLAALLATSSIVACSPSTELKRIRVPREGQGLAYVLEKGTGFEGTLRVGNTRPVDGLDQPLNQTATCEVTMVVLGPVSGGTEIRATFTGVELDWDLPPDATYSSDDLLQLAHERLRGMQVRFVVRPDGRVEELPTMPADAPAELAEVIETMIRGLEAFFVPLPPEPLRSRKTWDKSFAHTTSSGMKRSMDHHLTLDGMFKHRREDLTVARLDIEQLRKAQRPGARGPLTVERKTRSVLMFSPSGFPVELDRETQEFDPERGMVFRKVRAQWTSLRGQLPELITPAETVTDDVQVITDPCNPDYVGPKVCETVEPEPEPEPTPPTDADPPTDEPPSDDAEADADAAEKPADSDDDQHP